MSVLCLNIYNFKSIDHISLPMTELIALVGINGSGKTNLIEAIRYYYLNLTRNSASHDIFNRFYPRRIRMVIELEYDFNQLLSVAQGDYLFKVSKLINKYGSKGKVKVRMTQKKNGGIKWNVPFALREIVFNSHPVYSVDGLLHSENDWSIVWDLISDLVNKNFINKNLDYSSVFNQEKASQDGFNSVVEFISAFMKENNLTFEGNSKTESIMSLLILKLGGSRFQISDQPLSFSSKGTRHFEMMKFTIALIKKISDKKIKWPILLLDEPEHGLHPIFIDQLLNSIPLNLNDQNSFSILISTHSPRLVSQVYKRSGLLYSSTFNSGTSYYKKIIFPDDRRLLSTFNDQIASFLFSNFILFVEGPTEYELYRNPIILNLFPFLQNISLFDSSSNESITRAIDPRFNKTNIKFLFIYDMDKILKITDSTRVANQNIYDFKITFTSKWFFHKKYSISENLYRDYFKKRKYYKHAIKFNNDVKNSTYNANDKFFCSTLNKIYTDINLLYRSKNTYFMHTTTEGALVNDTFFIEWLISIGKVNIKDKELLEGNNSEICRYLVNGRSFFLNTFKNKLEWNFPNSTNYGIKGKLFDKTDGWITDYLQFWYNKHQNLTMEELKVKFAIDFPEIYDTINLILSIME